MYTTKMKGLLGEDHAHVSMPIVAAERISAAEPKAKYELFTTHHESVGVFDEVVFACHPPTAAAILEQGARRQKAKSDKTDAETEALKLGPKKEVLDCLKQISYADNTIYVHSDPKLMPLRQRAWASWNCLGKMEEIKKSLGQAESSGNQSTSTSKEAFEGAESGFGAKLLDNGNGNNDKKEGDGSRMKAVYVTYWLNRLQNLDTKQNYFVSLNPHEAPNAALTHKRVTLAHPQFTPATLQARTALLAENKHQGQDGLWFCGAWAGYGFHEDGCRSGFDVATKMSTTPLPWVKDGDCDQALMVLPPPDLSSAKASSSAGSASLLVLPFRLMGYLHHQLTYQIPVTLCKWCVLSFMASAVQHGTLRLKDADGSVLTKFGDGSKCGCDDSPVTLRIFDPWFYVKVAMEYDLGLAR
jgi:cyclopropane-fatty-acyl-phospholipid synthase